MTRIVGIDVGGTPTDPYFSADPGSRILEVPSTLQGASIGLLNSLQSAGIAPADINARCQQGNI